LIRSALHGFHGVYRAAARTYGGDSRDAFGVVVDGINVNLVFDGVRL